MLELVSVLLDTGKFTVNSVTSSETVNVTSVASVRTSATSTVGAVVSFVTRTETAESVLPSESVIVAVTV